MNENEQKNLSVLIVDALRVKGITVEKLSLLTGIPERPITLLIEEKFDKLPPAPYVHGYLMKIAEVLNLDGQKLWAEYLKDNETIRRSGEHDQLPKNRFQAPRFSKQIIWLSLAALIIVGYGLIRIADFYSRPNLEISNIPDNVVVTNPDFKIIGQMDPTALLTLNNEQIYPDKNGRFEKEISLQPGFNPLIFKIKKPLGKEYTVTKQISYQASGTNNKNTTSTP